MPTSSILMGSWIACTNYLKGELNPIERTLRTLRLVSLNFPSGICGGCGHEEVTQDVPPVPLWVIRIILVMTKRTHGWTVSRSMLEDGGYIALCHEEAVGKN